MAISGVLFSCAKEELDYGKLNLIGDPKPITVNATLPKSAGTDKTVLAADGKVKWELSDRIVVNETTLPIDRIVSETQAVFQGEVGDITTTYGSGYWATYPASLNATDYSSNSVNVTLPATQTYKKETIPSYMAAFNTAEGDKLDLQFKNLCCIIKIPVSASGKSGDEAKLTRIEITATQSNSSTAIPISGTSTVTWSSNEPALACSGSNTVALDCGSADVSTEKTFSIMLPSKKNYQFVVKFYDGRGLFMTKNMKLNGTTLLRNTIYTTSTVNLDIPNSAFSVSADKQVYLSSGNLQYNPSLDQWRFAPNQWDRFDNNTKGHHFDVNAYSPTGTSWIDLFAWGTSNYAHGAITYQPWATDGLSNTNYMAYGDINCDLDQTGKSGSADWGYGRTFNGKSDWRTLKYSEWDYMLNSRANAAFLKSTGNIDGVNGAIILPDAWVCPSGVTFVPGATLYTVNSYTSAQWAIMESAGAVFLPAAGSFDCNTTTNVSQVNNWGWYWSTTHDGMTAGNGPIGNAFYAAGGLVIVPDKVFMAMGCDRSDGYSVRLARDAN